MKMCSKTNCPINLYAPEIKRKLSGKDANAKAIKVKVSDETYIILYATKDIQPGEEILWLYHEDNCEETQPVKTRDEDSHGDNDPPPDESQNTAVASRTSGAEAVNAFEVNTLNYATCYPTSCVNIDKKKVKFRLNTPFKYILLDCAAGCSIFKDANLLKDIKENETPIGVRGVNRTAPLIAKDASFYSSFGLVALCPQASDNILSMGEMRDRGHRISYYTKTDHSVMTAQDGTVIPFTRHGRHYKYKVSLSNHTHNFVDTYDFYAQTDNNIPGTSTERAAIYPKRAVQRAIDARRLQARLGYPTSKDFASMNIQGADVTPKDVAIADHVFGPPTAILKGRTTKKASPPIVPNAPVVIEANQTLEVDIMFINRLPFLVGILVPLGYSLVDFVPNRAEKEIHQSLYKFLAQAKSRGITTTHVISDNEGSIRTAEVKLNSMSIQLSTTAAGEKAHRVERRIRFIKERVRAIMHSLPYQLCAKLLAYCVYYGNWCTNNHRMAISTHTRTPHELFTGRNLLAKRDLRHAFGDFVQATVPHPDNSMNARTESCIALIHSGSLTGGVIMYCIKTQRTCVRDQFRVLPTPKSLITHLNTLAKADDMPALDVESDDTLDNVPLPPPPSLRGVNQSSLAIPIDPEWRGEKRKATRASKKAQEDGERLANELDAENNENPAEKTNPNTIAKRIQIEPYEDGSDDDEQNAPQPRNNEDEMYWSENNEDTDITFVETFMTHVVKHSDTLLADVLNISVKKALVTHGQSAEESMMKEIRQLWEKDAWVPIRKGDIPELDRNRVIRSFMFLKEKYTAEGLIDKLKSRLVANGKQQDRQLYETLASPTAALMSLFTVAGIAAHENRKTATVDIGGAFLHASPKEANPIYVVLDKVMSKIMIDIDPTYTKYANNNGEIIVKLTKALYGCVESALLWYNHISDTMENIGFKKNVVDPCVFNMRKEGVQCTVVLHVDDLFLTCVEEEEEDSVLNANMARRTSPEEVGTITSVWYLTSPEKTPARYQCRGMKRRYIRMGRNIEEQRHQQQTTFSKQMSPVNC